MSAKWDWLSGAIFASPLVEAENHAGNVKEVHPLLAGGRSTRPASISAVPRAHQSRHEAVHNLCSRKASEPRGNPGSRSGCLDPIPPGCRHRVEQFVARQNRLRSEGWQLLAQCIDADLSTNMTERRIATVSLADKSTCAAKISRSPEFEHRSVQSYGESKKSNR